MLAGAHIVFGFASLIFGTIVLLRPKGTATHIAFGRAYVFSMIALCATSFGIYDMFGGFGIFHIAAIFSLVSIAAGIGAALFRRKLKGWIFWHYQFMSWSYIGLLGATSNEAYANIGPLNTFAINNPSAPWLTLMVLFLIGAVYVNAVMKSTVRKAGFRVEA